LGPLECLALGLTSRALCEHLIARPKLRANGAFLVLRNGSTALRDKFHWDARALAACEYWREAPTLDVYLWYAEKDETRWWPTSIYRMVPHCLIRDGRRVEELKHYLGHHLWAKAPRRGFARVTKVAVYDEIKDVAERYKNRTVLKFLGFLYSVEHKKKYGI
jgi:hypothetical protein